MYNACVTIFTDQEVVDLKYRKPLIDETISIIVIEPAKQSFFVLSLLVFSPSPVIQ